MNKITLHDIYEIQNRMEDKIDKLRDDVDKKIGLVCIRVDALEAFKDNVMGKITMLTGIFSLSFTIVWQLIKERIGLDNK